MRLRLRLTPVDDDLERAMGEQLAAFLQPRADELLARLAADLGAPVPDDLTVDLVVVDDDTAISSLKWHEVVPDRRVNGLRTLERVLVHVTAAMDPHREVAGLHTTACAAIAAAVDPTFVCALELQ